MPSTSGVGGDIFCLGWEGLRWPRDSSEVTGMPGAPEVQPPSFILRARLYFGGKLEFLVAGVSRGDWGFLLKRIQTTLKVEIIYPTPERVVPRVQTPRGRAWA